MQIGASIVAGPVLVPDDFGLLGMAMVVMALAQLFADFGIGSAIVQSRTNDEVVLSSCFWANAVVAWRSTLLVALLAPVAGMLYRDPRVTPILTVLALGLLISGLTVMPRAILYRDLNFAAIAKAQLVGSLVGALAAVALAWRGPEFGAS